MNKYLHLFLRHKCGNISAYWFEDLLAVNEKKKKKVDNCFILRPKKNVYIFSNFKKTLIKHSISSGRIPSPVPLKVQGRNLSSLSATECLAPHN